jgi:alpha-tubulin suppressor-like RCC1 family protein
VLVAGGAKVIAIEAGNFHSLAVASNGAVFSWGYGNNGQLGTGNTTASLSPITIPGLANVKAVGAGLNHSLALLADGSVKAWGSGANGQLGLGTTANALSPASVPGLASVASISAGQGWSHAVKTNGELWSFGLNSSGQLGLGDAVNRLSPTLVSMVSGLMLVDAGFSHALTIGGNGAVFAFGQNAQGQLGLDALRQVSTPRQIDGLAHIAAIASSASSSHDAFRLANGSLMVFGRNTNGQLVTGDKADRHFPTTIPVTNMAAVSAGYDHTLIRKSDNTVWGAGYNNYGQLGLGNYTEKRTFTQVPNLTNAAALVASGGFSLVLKTDGTVVGFGWNGSGQITGSTTPMATNVPLAATGLTGVTGIAAGSSHSLAVLANGTVRAWGSSGYGERGGGSLTTSIPNLTSVTQIAAGSYFSLFLRNDGAVYATGTNNRGQLGLGDTTQRYGPVQISGLTGIVSISAGTEHALAIKNDGTAWSWGSNYSGQLGTGSTPGQSNVPVKIPGISGAIRAVAGGGHSLILKQDGTAQTFGSNSNGQLGVGLGGVEYTPSAVPGLNVLQGAPFVAITSPAQDSYFAAGEPFTLQVLASDADGVVSKVEFYHERFKLGESAFAPFSLPSPCPPGATTGSAPSPSTTTTAPPPAAPH